jgi:hypothetical protein
VTLFYLSLYKVGHIHRASTLARGWMEFTWPKIDARHVFAFYFVYTTPGRGWWCARSLPPHMAMDFLIIQRPSSWDFRFESIGPCCIGGWHSLNTRMQRGKIAWSVSGSWHDRGGNQFAWLHIMADNLVDMHKYNSAWKLYIQVCCVFNQYTQHNSHLTHLGELFKSHHYNLFIERSKSRGIWLLWKR